MFSKKTPLGLVFCNEKVECFTWCFFQVWKDKFPDSSWYMGGARNSCSRNLIFSLKSPESGWTLMMSLGSYLYWNSPPRKCPDESWKWDEFGAWLMHWKWWKMAPVWLCETFLWKNANRIVPVPLYMRGYINVQDANVRKTCSKCRESPTRHWKHSGIDGIIYLGEGMQIQLHAFPSIYITLKIHGKKMRKTPTLLPGVVTWCSGCKEVLWIVMNRACALVSLWLFSTVSRKNDVISWTNVYPHCLRVFERIHCFCSKGANVEKTIRHVQATFWLHCDSCSAHDIWKVSGKKLNHHCVYIYV